MGTLRDQILAAEDLPREQVTVDEWGLSSESPPVYVRGLTGKEREEFEQSIAITDHAGNRVPNPNMRSVRASFLVKTLVDESGERIFPKDSDATELNLKSSVILERLWNVGRRLSGMLTPDEEKAAANPSMGDQDGSSSSGSPLPSEYQTRTG